LNIDIDYGENLDADKLYRKNAETLPKITITPELNKEDRIINQLDEESKE